MNMKLPNFTPTFEPNFESLKTPHGNGGQVHNAPPQMPQPLPRGEYPRGLNQRGGRIAQNLRTQMEAENNKATAQAEIARFRQSAVTKGLNGDYGASSDRYGITEQGGGSWEATSRLSLGNVASFMDRHCKDFQGIANNEKELSRVADACVRNMYNDGTLGIRHTPSGYSSDRAGLPGNQAQQDQILEQLERKLAPLVKQYAELKIAAEGPPRQPAPQAPVAQPAYAQPRPHPQQPYGTGGFPAPGNTWQAQPMHVPQNGYGHGAPQPYAQQTWPQPSHPYGQTMQPQQARPYSPPQAYPQHAWSPSPHSYGQAPQLPPRPQSPPAAHPPHTGFPAQPTHGQTPQQAPMRHPMPTVGQGRDLRAMQKQHQIENLKTDRISTEQELNLFNRTSLKNLRGNYGATTDQHRIIESGGGSWEAQSRIRLEDVGEYLDKNCQDFRKPLNDSRMLDRLARNCAADMCRNLSIRHTPNGYSSERAGLPGNGEQQEQIVGQLANTLKPHIKEYMNLQVKWEDTVNKLDRMQAQHSAPQQPTHGRPMQQPGASQYSSPNWSGHQMPQQPHAYSAPSWSGYQMPQQPHAYSAPPSFPTPNWYPGGR